VQKDVEKPAIDIPTRETLLNRLRDWNDNDSWKVFFDTYWRLIFNCARRSGLTDSEAQDVVQETLISVLKSISDFRYDRSKGRFKGWLCHIANHRIIEHKRSMRRQERLIQPASFPESGEDHLAIAEKASDRIDTEHQKIWDEEWENNFQAAALERVKQKVELKHFQVFDLCLKQCDPRQIARTLNISRANVYLIKHRIQRMLRTEMSDLLSNPTLEHGNGLKAPNKI
jgi:RNA polymerase sigma-70 factor (ECF subfamily)